MTGPGAARALALACHPVPTAAVTLLAGSLAVAVDLAPGRVLLVALAVLAGQLSIGWSNDAVDADRDRASGRADKPLAQGGVGRRTVAVAGLVALGVTIVLSLALGWLPGLVHLLFVACGWAYNLGLKRTAWSWLPYAVGFAALPSSVALARPDGPAPPWWLAVAGALLGVGAHLVNVLPDLADDLATGVLGWPHRLGRARSAAAAAGSLVLASALLVVAPPGPPPVVAVALLVVAVACATWVAVAGRRATAGRGLLLGAVGVAAVDVVLLVVGAGTLG